MSNNPAYDVDLKYSGPFAASASGAKLSFSNPNVALGASAFISASGLPSSIQNAHENLVGILLHNIALQLRSMSPQKIEEAKDVSEMLRELPEFLTFQGKIIYHRKLEENASPVKHLLACLLRAAFDKSGVDVSLQQWAAIENNASRSLELRLQLSVLIDEMGDTRSLLSHLHQVLKECAPRTWDYGLREGKEQTHAFAKADANALKEFLKQEPEL